MVNREQRESKWRYKHAGGTVREGFTREAPEMGLERCVKACNVGARGEAKRDWGVEHRASDVEWEGLGPCPNSVTDQLYDLE